MGKPLDDALWSFQQQGRVLQELRSEIRGIWADQSARDLNGRYLDPHEEEEQRMRRGLNDQSQRVDDAARSLEAGRQSAARARELSDEVAHELRLAGQDIDDAGHYHEQTISYHLEARQWLPLVAQLIARANSACAPPHDGPPTDWQRLLSYVRWWWPPSWVFIALGFGYGVAETLAWAVTPHPEDFAGLASTPPADSGGLVTVPPQTTEPPPLSPYTVHGQQFCDVPLESIETPEFAPGEREQADEADMRHSFARLPEIRDAIRTGTIGELTASDADARRVYDWFYRTDAVKLNTASKVNAHNVTIPRTKHQWLLLNMRNYL